MFKRWIFIVLFLFVCANFASCKSGNTPDVAGESAVLPVDNSSLNTLIPSADVTGFHIEELYDKETPYTRVFKNQDGTTSLYVFSTPISYYDNKKLIAIDNSLIEITDGVKREQGYLYQNKSGDVKTYFSQKSGDAILLNYQEENFYIRADTSQESKKMQFGTYEDLTGAARDSVGYSLPEQAYDVQHIPTHSGVSFSFTFNKKPEESQLAFVISSNCDDIVVNNSGPVCCFDDQHGETKAVFNASFLVDYSGKTSVTRKMDVRKEETENILTLQLDEDFLNNAAYPVTITPSFQIQRETQEDATVYSTTPKINYAYSGFAVVGEHLQYGIGREYLSFRVNSLVSSYAENIKSASYNSILLLNFQNAMRVQLDTVQSFWEEKELTWSNQPASLETLAIAEITAVGRYSLDITDFICLCFRDDTWKTESCGLVLSCEQEGACALVATANNGLYVPYVRIDFYDEPWRFEKAGIE